MTVRAANPSTAFDWFFVPQEDLDSLAAQKHFESSNMEVESGDTLGASKTSVESKEVVRGFLASAFAATRYAC